MIRTRLLFALLLLSAPLFSQKQSLLWEVTGNGITKPSFIYGTMHVRDSRVFDFGDSVVAKFNKADAYAVEFIMDEETAKNIGEKTHIPGDTNLEMLIGKQNYKTVRDIASERLGVTVNQLNILKPYYTSYLLNDISRANDHHENLDQYFQALAKKKKMKLISIETFEEQMADIDRIPIAEQANILIQDLKELDHIAVLHEHMVRMYLNQDLDSIDIFVKETQNYIEEHKTSLIVDRNRIMAERIAHFAGKESVFVGINVIHITGKDGVLALLTKKGYKVRPIHCPFKK